MKCERMKCEIIEHDESIPFFLNVTKYNAKGLRVSALAESHSGNYKGMYNFAGFVFQTGLYNRIGVQTIPLINIRGWKNLFRRKKNKRESLEQKVK